MHQRERCCTHKGWEEEHENCGCYQHNDCHSAPHRFHHHCCCCNFLDEKDRLELEKVYLEKYLEIIKRRLEELKKGSNQ